MMPPHMTARVTVRRFKLRSATPEELRPLLTPPPNMSDIPPPRPLCSKMAKTNATDTITKMIWSTNSKFNGYFPFLDIGQQVVFEPDNISKIFVVEACPAD